MKSLISSLVSKFPDKNIYLTSNHFAVTSHHFMAKTPAFSKPEKHVILFESLETLNYYNRSDFVKPEMQVILFDIYALHLEGNMYAF